MIEIKAKLTRPPVYFANELITCLITLTNRATRWLCEIFDVFYLDDLAQSDSHFFAPVIRMWSSWPGAVFSSIAI